VKKKTCPLSLKVQTVLFDRKIYTAAQARAWLEDHGFKSLKVDTKKNTLRFRQVSPQKCEFMRTGKPFKKGVKPVYCCPKKG